MEEGEIQNSLSQEGAPQDNTASHAVVEQKAPETVEKDRDWRRMRQHMNNLEQELKKERELREQAMSLAMSQNTKKEVDELDAIGDEEFIPKGKVSKLVAKEAQKIATDIAKKETEKFIKEQNQNQFLDKLKRQYSDFDDVVNSDTLAILEQQDPELAEMIVSSNDPYTIGSQSYKYIKALNLGAKVPEKRRAKEVDQKLEKNANTVLSPQAYEKRPMAQAFKMTDAEKSKLYEEMLGYASQAGFSY